MDDQKTAPGADSGVLSLRKRVEAGWIECFKSVPIGGDEEAITPRNYAPPGFIAAPGDCGVWSFRGATSNSIIFSRWLVRA